MGKARGLEVWGGFECSVVRIGEDFRDQSRETGHADRLDDIDRAHALGLRTLRCPALWETISPDDPARCDWRWHDLRFERLQRLDMRPIVGLVHHGSGPRYTNLLDPDFPQLLARHAARVAERYPWVEAWTPVNEPLTTARFSALYGHWYPHAAGMSAFLRATVAQCKATVLAMRAVRRVVPGAQLIQTEDIGKVFGTPDLADQAGFENDRRWLSLDLLCGRVDRHHPWRDELSRNGISDGDLDLFLDADAAPDVIGVNHYLTSERFLDRDWRRYPVQFKGGNGHDTYADAEAVRAGVPAEDLGPAARLRDVLARYGRPVAITEVHHGCSREEQLRWLVEVWDAAVALRAEGADVRAVTVWSLAGAVDWNSLLVERRGAYEPGAFDMRAPVPRRTALARAVASLVDTGGFQHPVLGPGWWHRPERLYHVSEPGPTATGRGEARPLLIVGAGPLGRAFAAVCAVRGLPHVLARAGAAEDGGGRPLAAFAARRPWAVVDASEDREGPAPLPRSPALRRAGAAALATACERRGIPFVSVSSARAFDGRLGRASVEGDAPCPLDAAGAAAVARERSAMALNPASLVVRTGPLFGFSEARDGPRPAIPDDPPLDARGLVSPTYLPDLAHATLDLLIDGERGLWHLANAGQAPWGDFTARLADATRIPAAAPHGVADGTFALASEKAWIMPTLEDAFERFAREFDLHRRAAASRMAAE